jgi:Peptidase M76 family
MPSSTASQTSSSSAASNATSADSTTPAAAAVNAASAVNINATSSSAASNDTLLPGATERQVATCDGYIRSALTSNTTIQFLLQRLEQMGCTPPPEGFISCQNCQGKPVSGGFGMLQEQELVNVVNVNNDNENEKESITTTTTTTTTNHSTSQQHHQNRSSPPPPDCTRSAADILDKFQRDKEGLVQLHLQPEIYLCAEHVVSATHAHTILTHELIHAIDVCRSTMDPLRNCLQLACTEIRAENLSGECNVSWELMRAKLDSTVLGHGQQCVRRRAMDSVKANPNCTEKAAWYVDAAMERCYADTFPFERHPNQR